MQTRHSTQPRDLAPHRRVRRCLLRLVPIGVAFSMVVACFGSDAKSPGGDPVAMSRSKYDMAADLWLRQGRPRQALEQALEAVKLDDENYEAAHLVALIYLDFCRQTPTDCRLEEAERFARRAIAIEPEFREGQNTLGVVLIHRKQYDQAIAVLKPLTADILYQTPENAWGNLGWAYLESGRLKLAIDALRRSVAAQPLFCVGNYRLGLAYERNGQPRLALEAFTRALETDDPRCKRMQAAYAARGHVQLRLGAREPAREDFERCAKMSSTTDAGKECSSMLGKLK